MSQTTSNVRRRSVCALAVLALAWSCGSEDESGPARVHARDRPLVPRASEREELQAFARTLEGNRGASTRVLVQLEGLLPTSADGTTLAGTTAAERKVLQSKIRQSQAQFLEGIRRANDARARSLQSIPFVALEVTRDDIVRIDKWMLTTPMGTDRPYRIRLERVRDLKGQCMPALAQDTPIDQIKTRLEMVDTGFTSAGPVIAVIDGRIDDSFSLLTGRIEAREAYAIGYPSSLATEPPLVTGASPNHATQVACVVAACDPWLKILALRADEGTDSIPTDNVLAALDAAATKWSTTLAGRLTAIALSLGDPDQPASNACDAGPVDAAAFADVIAALSVLDIAVVLPAGNSAPPLGSVLFPACISTAVTVAATDGARVKVAGYSCWSSIVDLCAPGTGVKIEIGSPYPAVVGPGTSIAVPFVASALGILRGTHPGRSMVDLIAALEQTGDAVTPPPRANQPAQPSVPEIRMSKAAAWLDTQH